MTNKMTLWHGFHMFWSKKQQTKSMITLRLKMRMMEIKAEWEYSNFFLILWIIATAILCNKCYPTFSRIVNVLLLVQICTTTACRVYKMGYGAVTWILKTKKKGLQSPLHISGFNAFQKKILCLCYIKTCCFWYYLISCLLLAFLTLKNVLDFVRNFVTQTFASPHLSTRWFAKNPIRCLWLLNKEG